MSIIFVVFKIILRHLKLLQLVNNVSVVKIFEKHIYNRNTIIIFYLSQDNNTVNLTNHALDSQSLPGEQPSPAASTTPSDTSNHPVNFGEIPINNVTSTVLPEAYVSARQPNTLTTGKTIEVTLLDERSLLACIVRTMPAGSGGKIRISSTVSPFKRFFFLFF